MTNKQQCSPENSKRGHSGGCKEKGGTRTGIHQEEPGRKFRTGKRKLPDKAAEPEQRTVKKKEAREGIRRVRKANY